MTTLEENLVAGLNDVVLKHNMVIDELHYFKRGKEFILQIYVEREDLSPIELDAIVSLSEDLSTKLDELDLIQDNYCLDVSTSGADKPIKDFSKFPLLIGKYMEIRLINPINGLNIYEGVLKEVNNEEITLSYRVKTRTKEVIIKISNINKAKLTVKV